MDSKTTEKTDGLQTPQELTAGDGARRQGRDGGRTAVSNGAAAPGMGMEGGMGMGMGGGGGAAPVSLKNLRTFTSFKNPVYRIYFASLFFQMGAMNMQMLTRSLLIYRLTGSATILGVMALANSVPMLFFSFYGGVLADRLQKKWVILVGDLCYAAISLAVAVLLVTGVLSQDRPGSWWILIVYSLASGTIMGLMMPARQAVIAEIVSESQLMNAVSLNTFGMNFNRMIMPAIGGFMVEAFDFGATYFFMTALYVLAAVFVAFLPITGTVTLRGRGAWADIKDGVKYVRHEPTILLILAVTLFTVLLSMPYMMLLPVFTEDILKVGAGGMGVLLSVSGIGAIVGSLVLASLPNKRRGAMMMWGSLLLGLALVGFSFSSSWSVSLVMIVFVGLGQTARMTLGNTLLQYYVTDEYRGRVMSIYLMEFGLTSFGVFFTGVMADVVGGQWGGGGLALMLVIMCIGVLAFSPRMRRLD